MLELKNISKIIDDHVILNDISIHFPSHGLVGIKGRSGSGKSSLLYILSMLDEDFLGSLFFNSQNIDNVDEYRKNHISYMMQSNDYIDALTVKENIILSSYTADKNYSKSHLHEIVKRVGIEDLLDRYPHTLSGGQLKRMSIAKALLKESEIILCDEPTGALFFSQSHDIMQLLKDISKEKLVIIVSHDELLLKEYADYILTLENGKLIGRIDETKNVDIKSKEKKKKNLFFYVMRQMLKQKYKYSVFVFFQWFLITVFLLVLSASLGIVKNIHDTEENDVYKNIIVIENKDHSDFKNIISGYRFADYNYNLDFLECKSLSDEMLNTLVRFMPQNTDHIKLISGNLPVNENEVIVSEKLYESLHQNEIIMKCGDFSYRVYVSGVIRNGVLGANSIYLSHEMKDNLSFLKDDYSLVVESDHVKDDYVKLQKDYYAYNETIDQSENYETLLSYGKVVTFICIFMSLVVSLILYSIVSSIILEERTHDLCYLKTLGLNSKRLYKLTFLENMVLSGLIVVGGIIMYEFCFYYLNRVYDLYSHFYFSLERITLFFGQFDIYVIIFLLYALLCCLCNRKTFGYIQNLSVIDVLREE